ncbi:hypothetical protein TrVGV298_002213 [Trichoderma virens]|nr:hypothetical protein TrVGV298_002213 [Trichoderma virens]
MPATRISKTCDECRNRKVRCVVSAVSPGAPAVCTNCVKRNKACLFSNVKARSLRVAVKLDAPPPLMNAFIDRLLQDPSESAPLYDEFSILRVDDRRGQPATCLAIFAMNACSLQIDNFLLAEASRTVLALRYHKSSLSGANSAVCYRAFWVVYHMEKQYNFQARSSSGIVDLDIGCQIPPAPESVVNGYNWFVASIRISRIFSITYDSFFSVTASAQSAESLLPAVSNIQKLLDDWRQSIPPAYRPHESLQRSVLADLGIREIAIRTHFYYFHLVIALERMKLHLSSDRQTTDDSLRTLLRAARTVVELTRFIDVEPYTPVFILAIMPLSALFILFDFVIHNPAHPDTRQNLILLDIVSGHFSLLEHVSGGVLPGSYLSRFGNIARQYAEEFSSQPDDNMRTNASLVVRDDENSPNSSPRADTTLHGDTEVDGATTSNSPNIRSEFDQDPSTGLDGYLQISGPPLYRWNTKLDWELFLDQQYPGNI